MIGLVEGAKRQKTQMCIRDSGIASATYHPQASKTVNFLSDENSKAKTMGIFSLGGNAGMAVGSILMTFLLGLQDGIHNTMYFIPVSYTHLD